jgi:adenylate kinase
MTRLLAGNSMQEVVIHLAVDYNVIIARMQGRRVCPKCGTLYNSVSRPPQTEGICDLDGETLVIREDDKPEVVRERLEQYEAQTCPVIEFFRADNRRVFDVDASKDRPEVVFARIREMLESLPGVSAKEVSAA